MAIVAGIAAIIALKEKVLIVTTGIVGGIALGAIAIQAVRRNDKAVGSTVAIVAAVCLSLTAVYGLTADTPGADPRQPNQNTSPETAAPRMPKTSPDTSATASPAAGDQPIFEGSVEITAGQAVDLETASPKAGAAAHLAAPADIFIDRFAFAYDRDGYLAPYTGKLSDGKRECRDLLELRDLDDRELALPQKWYCATTSEKRTALLRFEPSDSFSKVGSVTYQVWDY